MTIYIKVINDREIVLYSGEEGVDESYSLIIEESRFNGKRLFRITSTSDLELTFFKHPAENTVIDVSKYDRFIVAKADDDIEEYK